MRIKVATDFRLVSVTNSMPCHQLITYDMFICYSLRFNNLMVVISQLRVKEMVVLNDF